MEYLTESLQCYIHGLNRAAAVMLGGASEQAVLLLIDACGNWIADAQKRTGFQTQVEKSQTIFRKFSVFETHLTAARHKMPKELTDNLDSLLRGIFDLIRSSRNDAGHPATGGQVTQGCDLLPSTSLRALLSREPTVFSLGFLPTKHRTGPSGHFSVSIPLLGQDAALELSALRIQFELLPTAFQSII